MNNLKKYKGGQLMDNAENQWDRLPKETSRQYEAFCIYRDMGPDRSILKVAQEWSAGGHTSKLKEWSSKHHWVERALHMMSTLMRLRRARNEEAIIEMSARHADYSLQIQEKAIEALNSLNPKNLNLMNY